jgi:N-acylneuraminate cytidylyltransferase
MKTIAVIPARGGSKGIPRKNVIEIAGKPMLAWNIEAAKASRFVDAVYVSTDDAEIAEVARHYGAGVIDRPAELANDTATSESALVHALELVKAEGDEPDLLVFMQCTSPLTATEDIDNAIQKLLDEKADSCLTVTDFHYFVWKEQADGTADGINHDKRFRPRRQDREPQFVENGAIYVMKVPGFLAANHRFFGKTVISKMPQERCFEIDEPVDLKIAEGMLLEALGSRRLALGAQSTALGSRREALGINLDSPMPSAQRPAPNAPCLMPNARPPAAVLFDFDGVFTNNKVYLDETGRESVRCDRSDGWGLAQLKKSGIKIAVLSTEVNPVVSARCKKLGLECRQGLGEKKFEAFVNWCAENEIAPEDTIFVGNDANDAECLKAAGCGVVPADAYPEAIAVADKILKRNGGEGAVRELCEEVMKEGR